MNGKLNLSLYGTRDAAQNLQKEYIGCMRSIGFQVGKASPSKCYHSKLNISCTVHGDDFTAAGPKDELDWFEAETTKRYVLTVGGRLGPGPLNAKEATVLNRVIRWTSEGF